MKHWCLWLASRKFAVLAVLFLGLAGGFYVYLNRHHVPSQAGHYELEYSEIKQNISLRNKNALNAYTRWFDMNHVSIAQLDEQLFVTANYTNLFLIDLKRNESCVLVPDSDRSEILGSLEDLANVLKGSKKATYNPTGVYVDTVGDLYLANYKGNNILRGRVDRKNCQIEFVQSFHSDATRGPENVAVNREKDVLVSANYDAGTVTAFRISTGAQIWSAMVGQAHGVTIKDDKVYATGLTDRKVYELALSDGRLLRSTGSLGWNPLSNEFLWPTSIYPIGEKELVISDPQTGFISFMDQKSLAVSRYTGGNGPGEYRFSFPYAAFPTKDGMLVLSSMRGEFLETNRSATKVMKRYRLRTNVWPALPGSIASFGDGWKQYINKSGPRLNINNRPYNLAFGHLHPLEHGPAFRVPDISTLYNFGAYLYFLQGAKVADDFSYFFSSSSTSLLGIYHQPGKPAILINKNIPLDSWLVNGELVSPNAAPLPQAQVHRELSEKGTRYYDEIEKHGWLPAESLFQLGGFSVFTRKLGFDEFKRHLDTAFVSDEGRSFKLAYDKCTGNACNVDSLKTAAKIYYFEASGRAYANLDEYLLVGMLAGVTPDEAAQGEAKIEYDDCGSGKYYDGYGLHALRTESLEDYLSAASFEGSSICFLNDGNQETSLNAIQIVWHSQSEIPKRLAVWGISNDNKEIPLLQVANMKAIDVGGQPVTTLTVDSQSVFSKYKIKMLEGGSQNRLILRALSPVFARTVEANDWLSRLAMQASQQLKYGPGVNKLPDTAGRTPGSVMSAISAADSAHCGNYVFYFVNQLAAKARWQAFDLKARDGRNHSVAEVHDQGKTKTVDPTLGIVYNCSLQSMLDGHCNFNLANSTQTINPALQAFQGAGFFYGAVVVKKYSSIDDLVSAY